MPKTVLIIEDDPDIAECLRIGLENAQLKARVALTGDDGLAASLDKDNPAAAILLDLLLPGRHTKRLTWIGWLVLMLRNKMGVPRSQ